jgi:hypothetical protein
MPITNFKIQFPGQTSDGVLPRFGHLLSTDTLATIVAAGYLNPYLLAQGFDVKAGDFIFVSASDGQQIYKPVFAANGTITLTVLP